MVCIKQFRFFILFRLTITFVILEITTGFG